MHSDWKNICTSAKALITKQTNNSAVKIFSSLFLKSKFSTFWPNSVGVISKTIQPIYPKFYTELAKGGELQKRPGDFFLFMWFRRNFKKTARYLCKTAISTLQVDKKVTTCLNANHWNVIVNQFSFILMEYKLCRGVNWFLRWNFTMKTSIFETRGSSRFRSNSNVSNFFG